MTLSITPLMYLPQMLCCGVNYIGDKIMNINEFLNQVTEEKESVSRLRQFIFKGVYGYPKLDIPYTELSLTDGYKDGFGDYRYTCTIGIDCKETGLRDRLGRNIWELPSGQLFVIWDSTSEDGYDWRYDSIHVYTSDPVVNLAKLLKKKSA